MTNHGWSWWWLPAAATLWAASCTYDFDAAFSETPTSTGNGASGATTSTGSSNGGNGNGGGAVAGSGGVGGGGGEGTGARSGGENCANNLDDDHDDFVDCADPDCVPDWECTQPAPQDWEGPAMFFIGNPGSVPSCAPPWGNSLPGGLGLTVPDAVCAACGCGTPVLNCPTAELRLYSTSSCSGPPNYEHATNENQCEIENSPIADGYRAVAENPTPGSHCDPNGGGVQSLPAATWDQEAVLCSGTVHAGGCTNNNLCVPQDATSPFARCIYRAGDTYSCPTGSPYNIRYEFATTMTEGRSCTACSCNNPTNIQCDGTYRLWDNPGDCGVLAHDLEVPTSPGQCVPDSVGLGSNYELMFVPAYTSDACTVSADAVSTGTVTADDAYTVCCLP